MFVRGVYIGTSREVLIEYFKDKQGVMLDVFACLPYLCISLTASSNSLERRLLQMLRVAFNIVPAIQALGDTFLTTYRSSIDPALVRVLMMTMWLLCVSHWIGCLWWIVGRKQIDWEPDPAHEPMYWGPSPWLLEQGFEVQYIQAFLWGLGMMTTQMPYDVMPSTGLESLLTGVALIVALNVRGRKRT
eukprot:512346-Prymnesium_polylepis.1